jgi:hypothetical protein
MLVCALQSHDHDFFAGPTLGDTQYTTRCLVVRP